MMCRRQVKPRAQLMEKLAKGNVHYAYELAKKNLGARCNRDTEVKRIVKQMRL